MGRRSHYTHFHTGEFEEKSGRPEKVILCEKNASWLNTASENRVQVTCPKCCHILAERDLEKYNAEHPDAQLALEKTTDQDNIGFDARFAYRAMYRGEHVGFVIFAGAYGGGRWHLTCLTFDDREGTLRRGSGGAYIAPKKDSLRIGGYIDSDDISGEELKKSVRRFGHNRDGIPFPSKIDALLIVPHLVGDDANKHPLYSVATLTKTREANARWREKREREIAAQDAREAEELKDALAGLYELRDDRTDISNFQRNAVLYAIQRLEKKERD